jgi:hypothetical protein
MRPSETKRSLRRDHPVFFWGTLALVLIFAGASAVVASRVPSFRQDAELLDRRMSNAERATRDRVLNSEARRSELALGLLRREIRVNQMKHKGLHLAIDTDSSMLYLRHGPATLQRASLEVGPDSVIRAPDGRAWRFVQALGERRLQQKETNPDFTVPEWVYLSRGQTPPADVQRRIPGGLGTLVFRLDDGTAIYSRPQAGPLREGVLPGAFVVNERDMRAIFDAVERDTPVFIY